jgi:hypothetical protein
MICIRINKETIQLALLHPHPLISTGADILRVSLVSKQQFNKTINSAQAELYTFTRKISEISSYDPKESCESSYSQYARTDNKPSFH